MEIPTKTKWVVVEESTYKSVMTHNTVKDGLITYITSGLNKGLAVFGSTQMINHSFDSLAEAFNGITFKFNIIEPNTYRVHCPKCGAPLFTETEYNLDMMGKELNNNIDFTDLIFTIIDKNNHTCSNCDCVIPNSLVEKLKEAVNRHHVGD